MSVSAVSESRAFDISLVNEAMKSAVNETIEHDNRLLRLQAGAPAASQSGNGDVGQNVDTVA